MNEHLKILLKRISGIKGNGTIDEENFTWHEGDFLSVADGEYRFPSQWLKCNLKSRMRVRWNSQSGRTHKSSTFVRSLVKSGT